MRNPKRDRTGRARARGRQLDGAAGVEAENVTMTDVVGGAGAEVEICAERGARVGGDTDVTVVATTATVVATRRRRVGRGSFLAAAMENAAKARLGVVPLGGSRGGLGIPGGSATAGMNKPVGRFFDNQGRFINPEGGFNPSGAPRRIPGEHAQWGDWECEACGGHNRKHRAACFTCSVLKPAVPKEPVYTSSVAGRRPTG